MTVPIPTILEPHEIRAKAAREAKGWLLDDIWPAGGKGLIYGKPSDGKTRWLAALSVAVATGTPFAGRKVKAGGVLWIYLEHQWSDIDSYLTDAAHGFGAEDWMDLPVRALNRDGRGLERFDVYNTPQMEALAERLTELGTVLVIVDSARAAGKHDENQSEEVRELLDQCGLLTSGGTRLVIVIHHPSKLGKTIRGSLDFQGSTDQCVAFTLDRNDPALIRLQTQPHGMGDRKTWLLEAHHGKGKPLWYSERGAVPMKAKAANEPPSTRARLIEALRKRDGLPTRQVIQNAGVRVSEGTKHLRELAAEGVVELRPEGVAKLVYLRPDIPVPEAHVA